MIRPVSSQCPQTIHLCVWLGYASSHLLLVGTVYCYYHHCLPASQRLEVMLVVELTPRSHHQRCDTTNLLPS